MSSLAVCPPAPARAVGPGKPAGHLPGAAPLLHVDRLVDAIAAFRTRGPRLAYELVAGRWQPVEDPRPLAGLGGAAPAVVARGAGCGPAAA
jgi:hypothetical protein